MKKYIFRTLGTLLGLLFIGISIFLVIQPVKGDLLEKINIFTFIVIGIIFIRYGLTGKNRLFKANR